MDYLYFKAIHIIFVVTWFAGLFYMPRLLIYNVEALDKEPVVKDALQSQFRIMMTRLWYGITWPSAILTLIMGLALLFHAGWWRILLQKEGLWLLLKLLLVVGLYVYQIATHYIFKQQLKSVFKYSSNQLRMWNEVATIFLISIVILVVVKQGISLLWGMIGTILLVAILMLAIKVYKRMRKA